MAGVALSAHQARFAWQAWHVQYLHRCPRKLGDELVTWTPLLSVWLAWHFQHIRPDLRGRRGTFGTYIDIRGSLTTNWSLGRRCFLGGWRGTFSMCCVAGVARSVPTWMSAEAWRRTGHVDAAAFWVAGVALSACEAHFAWQA